MIRLASALVLLALLLLLAVVIEPRGGTAIAFSFVGMPAMGTAVVVYAYHLYSERQGGGGGTAGA